MNRHFCSFLPNRNMKVHNNEAVIFLVTPVLKKNIRSINISLVTQRLEEIIFFCQIPGYFQGPIIPSNPMGLLDSDGFTLDVCVQAFIIEIVLYESFCHAAVQEYSQYLIRHVFD